MNEKVYPLRRVECNAERSGMERRKNHSLSSMGIGTGRGSATKFYEDKKGCVNS